MKRILYIGNYLQGAEVNDSFMYGFGQKLEGEGYLLTYASSKRNMFLRMVDMLLSIIRFEKEIDVVLIDTYSSLNFYYALFASQLCRMLDKPYICILHGGNLPNRLKNNPYLSDLIFKNSYANVAPSEYLKSAFQEHAYKNIHYIPNSINIQNYPLHKKTFTTINLLWVRSFSKIYNPTLAVMVLKYLVVYGFESRLCMIGPDTDGSLRETNKLAENLNLNVKFTGKLDKKEWIGLSKGYNVFINTTNFDNTPLSVIEAMALGLPIVSTTVGGMPFLVENETHGLLVPPDDPEKMGKAIIRLFEDPNVREKLIANARLRAEQFDWQEIKYQWHAILKKNKS